MGALHTHLHLQHRKHTGKLLTHHHTSYRGIMVLLLVAGTAILGMNLIARAAADALVSVGATVAVPAPTAPAGITSPANGTTETTGATLVAGNCPFTSPQPVVIIRVDGTAAGSAICDTSNRFALPLSLSTGNHTLIAQAASITGGMGPASTAVYVHTPHGSVVPDDAPVITATNPFIYLGTGNTAVWDGSITGGTPPYHVRIDWGDGTQDTQVLGAATHTLSHIYRAYTPHNIYLTASSHDYFATAQYAVVTPTNAPVTDATDTDNQSLVNTSTAFGLYGLYVTLLAVFGIIWLEAKHAGHHVPVIAH